MNAARMHRRHPYAGCFGEVEALSRGSGSAHILTGLGDDVFTVAQQPRSPGDLRVGQPQAAVHSGRATIMSPGGRDNSPAVSGEVLWAPSHTTMLNTGRQHDR
jgi:hypothetical protein